MCFIVKLQTCHVEFSQLQPKNIYYYVLFFVKRLEKNNLIYDSLLFLIDVFCNLPPMNKGVVANGKGPWVPGSMVEFKCDDSICELLGESSLTCLEDGKWSVTEIPFCDCGA